MAEAELERQRDAVDRVDRLIERAEQDPEGAMPNIIILRELGEVRRDLLGETITRQENEDTFVTKAEYHPFRDKMNRITTWLGTLFGAVVLAAFTFWLGSQRGDGL